MSYCDIRLEAESDVGLNHELIGSFIFSLLMHNLLNLQLLGKLSAPTCGWGEAYKASGVKYSPFISPQKYSKKTSKVVEASSLTVPGKRLGTSEYSEFDY